MLLICRQNVRPWLVAGITTDANHRCCWRDGGQTRAGLLGSSRPSVQCFAEMQWRASHKLTQCAGACVYSRRYFYPVQQACHLEAPEAVTADASAGVHTSDRGWAACGGLRDGHERLIHRQPLLYTQIAGPSLHMCKLTVSAAALPSLSCARKDAGTAVGRMRCLT